MMRKAAQIGLFALAMGCATMCLETGAWAHGGKPIEEDICGRRLRDGFIHVSLYQPQVDDKTEYCASIPATGAAIMVVDLVDYALRFKPVSVKVLDLTAEGEQKLVFSLPARVHPQGVIQANLRFEKAGKYLAVISREDVDHASGQMYLSVAGGETDFFKKNPMFMVIFAIAAVAIFGGLRRIWRGARGA